MQIGTCRAAVRGDVVAVPLGVSFVCPECGHALAAPVQQTEPPPRRSFIRPAALVGAALVLLTGAVLVGRQLAAVPPVASIATQPAKPPPIVAAMQPARPSVAPTVQTATPVQPVQTTQAVALQSAPPTPPVAPTPPPSKPPAPILAAASPPPNTAKAAALTAPPAAVGPSAALPEPQSRPLATNVETAPAAILPAPPATQQAVAPATDEVTDLPFSPIPLAGGHPDYPASLAADGRAGRVAVSCLIQTDGRPKSCRIGSVKGGAAFGAAVQSWLDRGHVRFRPLTSHGHPTASARSWLVSVEEPPGALAQARQKLRDDDAASTQAAGAPSSIEPKSDPTSSARPEVLPPASEPVSRVATSPPLLQSIAIRQTLPPATAKPDRPFSTHIVRGGTPEYPSGDDESRDGSVTVRCTIETDGAPSGCAVVRQSGLHFGKSVQAWLRSGRVRFAPILSGGEPVSRVQTWTVRFNPPQ